MRVKHLIRELQKLDPEAVVQTEGCDCVGDTFCVEVGTRGEVEIRRSSNFTARYDNGDDTRLPLPCGDENGR